MIFTIKPLGVIAKHKEGNVIKIDLGNLSSEDFPVGYLIEKIKELIDKNDNINCSTL